MTVLLSVAAATLALDGASKHLVSTYLVEGRLYGLAGGWGLRTVNNRRGSLAGFSVGFAVVTWLVLVAGVLLLSPTSALTAVGLGLVVGGATGNLADRLLRGVVVDFVVAGPWPIFNIADAALVGGSALAVGSMV